MPLPFEQQLKESDKAFAAFSIYLGMGPERSTDAVAKKLAKSRQLIRKWSAQHQWTERVQAHTAHMVIVEREATEAVARAKAVEWGKRQQEIREREWAMHEKCIAAAERAFKAFMERDKVYANLSDIARILETASKLGRLAAGMATEKTEVSGDDGGPIRVDLTIALEKIYGEGSKTVVDVEEAPTVQSALPEGTK